MANFAPRRQMDNNTSHIANHSPRTTLGSYLFLFLAIFMLTGLLPQYLDSLVEENVEISENIEDESEQEKKENKKHSDHFNNDLPHYAHFDVNAINTPDGQFHKWQNPSADIITPPPDFL